MRVRLALLVLLAATLACNAIVPTPWPTPSVAPTSQPPSATRRPAATPLPPLPSATRRPSATPAPSDTRAPSNTPAAASSTPFLSVQPVVSGVRACGWIPGVSTAASMPPEVVVNFTPTPWPTPTPPANSTVDAAVTQNQLDVYQQLWDTINETYLYPDFNGRDWKAIGRQYKKLIQAGLSDEDFYWAMDLMVAELGDDHSQYESPAQVAESEAQFAGHNDYVGIGVLWTAVPEAGRGVIILTFPGGPAAEAGLQMHDSILAVDGQPALDENGGLIDAVRGPEGSSVTLTVQTPGQEPRQLTLVRRRITGSVPLSVCAIPGTRVGYIFLPNVDDETLPDQFRQALRDLTESGPLDGLILDNRQNTGGASTVVEQILGLFVKGNVGSYVSRQETRALVIAAEDVGGSQDVPLVVLVGDGTASYGEIMSGILQSSGRAHVLGQTTQGNVEVLWGYDFSDGSRAWIAHETFQPHDQPGANWEQTGIIPDVQTPARWDLFSEASDPAIAVALKLLAKP